jgi:acyl-ACP thioesterase
MLSQAVQMPPVTRLIQKEKIWLVVNTIIKVINPVEYAKKKVINFGFGFSLSFF